MWYNIIRARTAVPARTYEKSEIVTNTWTFPGLAIHASCCVARTLLWSPIRFLLSQSTHKGNLYGWVSSPPPSLPSATTIQDITLPWESEAIRMSCEALVNTRRSEERRVGKECRSR